MLPMTRNSLEKPTKNNKQKPNNRQPLISQRADKPLADVEVSFVVQESSTNDREK